MKKTESKAAVKKATQKRKTKESQKLLTTAPESKKLTTKKEPLKISAKEEPKKLTAKKEPLKISAKEEPKKLTAKKEPKRIATKKTESSPKKSKKQLNAEKEAAYDLMTLEDCLALLGRNGFHYGYDDIYELLAYEREIDQIIEKLIETSPEFHHVTYEKNGCDKELVERLVYFVKATMEICAPDFAVLSKLIEDSMEFDPGEEFALNSEEYQKEFKLMEKLLMIGQRYHIDSIAEVGALLQKSVSDFPKHFMQFAYAALPHYQYQDVEYYEDFMYEVLGQFHDLFEELQLELQLDIADLFILHGNTMRGDEDYGYVLRDNQIKDYIYYRFAKVYYEIDLWKSVSIARDALQYVDWRYHYYDAIMEIASITL